jgi:hypothetical protein
MGVPGFSLGRCRARSLSPARRFCRHGAVTRFCRMTSATTVGHVQCLSSVRTQFCGGLTADLVALLVLEHPGPLASRRTRPRSSDRPTADRRGRDGCQARLGLVGPLAVAPHKTPTAARPDAPPRSGPRGPDRPHVPNASSRDTPPTVIARRERDTTPVASGPAPPGAPAVRPPRRPGRVPPTTCRPRVSIPPPLAGGRCGGLATTRPPKPARPPTKSVGRSPREPQGVPLSTRSGSGSPSGRPSPATPPGLPEARRSSRRRGGKPPSSRRLRWPLPRPATNRPAFRCPRGGLEEETSATRPG